MARSGSLRIKVEVPKKDIRKLSKALADRSSAQKRATYQAIKKTLRASPKMVTDLARGQITAKVKDLKDSVKTRQIQGGEGGVVRVKAKPISLEKFSHSPRVPRNPPPKKGVRSSVRIGQPHYHRHAFKAPDKGGTFRIFERKGKSRYPIKKLFGPSTYTLLRYNPRNREILRTRLSDRFKKELASQLSRFLARKR